MGAARRMLIAMLSAAMGVAIGGGVLLWTQIHDLPTANQLHSILTGRQLVVRVANSGEISVECHCPLFTNPQRIPRSLKMMAIQIEDQGFYSHNGISFRGLLRAGVSFLTTGKLRVGGSGITQQLVKFTFLNRERAVVRKLREAVLAFRIERSVYQWEYGYLSRRIAPYNRARIAERRAKDRILALYLSRAYFGHHAGRPLYGVEAAARVFWKKPLRRITCFESALLVSSLKAPSLYHPVRHRRKAHAQARALIRIRAIRGQISWRAAQHCINSGVRPGSKAPPSVDHRFYTDWVVSTLKRQGRTLRDGDRIILPYDANAQLYAQLAVRFGLRTLQRPGAITRTSIGTSDGRGNFGSAIVIRPDGAVIALVGGQNYARKQFNIVTQALRQPGSALKPFVYLAAIKQGFRATTLIDSRTAPGQIWPRNSNWRCEKILPVAHAMSLSCNVAAVRLMRFVGPRRVGRIMRAAGLDVPTVPDPSIALGSHEVTPLALAAGYAAIGNGGHRVKPWGVVGILDRLGRVRYWRIKPRPRRIASRRDIARLGQMLRLVTRRGTGRSARHTHFWTAGKTGTSQHNRDAIFAGFNGKGLTAVVWFGTEAAVGPRGMTGGNVAARSWVRLMANLHSDPMAPVKLALFRRSVSTQR